MPEEEIIYDDAVVSVMGDEEPEPIEEPIAPEPEKRGLTKADVLGYLAENPQDFEQIVHMTGGGRQPQQVQQQPQPQGDPRPHPDNFDTYEKYFEAKDAWDDRELERRIAAAVTPLTQAVRPMQSSQLAESRANEITRAYNVPEHAKGYLKQMLEQVDPAILSQMSTDDARQLAYMAKGYAADNPVQAPKPMGRVEPVASTGPQSYQLNTDKVTKGEWDAYMDIRRSNGLPTSGKAFIDEMKSAGYLK